MLSPKEVIQTKSDIKSDLKKIYNLLNSINIEQNILKPKHEALMHSKSVQIYFKNSKNGNVRASDKMAQSVLNFSLTEAMFQISSSLFTVSNMKESDITEDASNVFFVVFNNFMDWLIQ